VLGHVKELSEDGPLAGGWLPDVLADWQSVLAHAVEPPPAGASDGAGVERRVKMERESACGAALIVRQEALSLGPFQIKRVCPYGICMCCMQVSLLPSRIHVSGLDDIWHMSLSLNTGNVVTFDTTEACSIQRNILHALHGM
jgi:hypothetical protein